MNSTTTGGAAIQPHLIRSWLAPRLQAPGLVSICSKNNWTGIQTEDLDHALAWVLKEDRAGAEGIYARVTTVTSRFPKGTRGSASDSRALYGMWSDIDFGNHLHKAIGLPADADEARDIPRFAQLPDPTRTENSSGGLYCWWEFEQPLVIGESISFEEATTLAGDWQNILALGAKKMGVGYGTGVRDLARVLRLPGTVNRKPGRAPTLCTIAENDGPRYTLDALRAVAAQLRPAPKKRPTRTAPAPNTKAPRNPSTPGRGPMTILGEHACCGDILVHAGATYAEQYPGNCSYCGAGCQRWNRPGWDETCSRDGIAVHKDGAAVTIRSDNFPGITPSAIGHVLSPGQLFAALHHGGDESAASRDIIRAAHDREEATSAARALPAAVLDDVRHNTRRPADETGARPSPAGGAPSSTHPATRLRALVKKVAAAPADEAPQLLQWAARLGFTAGHQAGAEPRAVADAFRKAAARAGLDNDTAVTLIRAAYQEAGQ
ncbi:hypothetical protein [Streptomyces sp. NPDC001054]